MSEPELKQRLAAILAADAVGYSRLMAVDERATVAALDAARTVFREQIESSRGRVIDTAGDSVLAVFETASGAAALSIQQRLTGLTANVPDDRRLRLRIDVHLTLRISPRDRWVGGAHLAYAMAAFIEQDMSGLRQWSELAIQSRTSAPIRRVLMIAYAAETGDAPLLSAHLDRLQSFAPDFIPSLFRGDYVPFHTPKHMTMLLESLRKARLGN